MPDGVHQGMHNGGNENTVRLSPRPAIKNSSNRSEKRVSPIWEDAVVGDMREAENDGGGDPASGFI